MTDEEIVELYWKREQAAVAETQSKYEHYLSKVAYNILFDMEDSLECVNDTYMKAWNAIPPERPKGLSVFLAKITRCRAIDMVRRRTRAKRVPTEYTSSLSELEECLSEGYSPEAQLEEQLLEQLINTYLRGLPDLHRRLFVGRYYYMDSVKTVAGYCAVSEAKAKMILYRTRQGLKEYLEKEGFHV